MQPRHISSKMTDRLEKIAGEDAKRIQGLARDAARSGAYLYPVKVRQTAIAHA